MPKYYPLFPKCPFPLRDLSPTYFPAPTSPHPNLPRSGQLFCRADSRDQQTDSQQTDRTTHVATDIIYASLRIAVQPSTEKSIQFFTSFTTELLVRLTGLRPRIHCLRCLKSLCISTALRTVRNLQPKKYRPIAPMAAKRYAPPVSVTFGGHADQCVRIAARNVRRTLVRGSVPPCRLR